VLRISYVGEDGFEVHAPTEYGAALWDAIWDAGSSSGLVAAGGMAMDSLRLERGYRALGTDLRAEFTPREAGLGFAVSRGRAEFIGHAALATRPPAHRLSSLVLDHPLIVPLGKEPVLYGDEVAGFVTSANFGYTVGQSIALAYLPRAIAAPGNRLDIEYFGNRHAATVVKEPLYDRAAGLREQIVQATSAYL
jgi:glycine cleavage system aminomethyltransferase T